MSVYYDENGKLCYGYNSSSANHITYNKYYNGTSNNTMLWGSERTYIVGPENIWYIHIEPKEETKEEPFLDDELFEI